MWDLGMDLKSAGMKNCFQACSIIRMWYFKRGAGFQLHSSHHLAADDDEFAELGSPLVSRLRRTVKPMTEKNDRIKREEATQKALSPGDVTINDVHLPIHRGDGTVTVRIMNVCSKTSDYVVHAICQSCGFLIKVEKIDANTLDVFFGVENKSDAKNILKRLNCLIMDDCNWSASLQSGNDDASASSSDNEDNGDMSCNSCLKIGEQISELKRLYTMKKLHVEDLENLQKVIMHIRSQNDDLKEQI